ncbi:hypothetical protein Scep_018969 [Stephania cephalantha]|uniref:DPH4 homolog n=1 Tax=Stephania cephalantha TaxID=152367 RepID=A0AAP0IA80_9MAGN
MLFLDDCTFQRTHYDILSVREDASYEEIRACYRSAVLNCHPDKLLWTKGVPEDHHELQQRFIKVQKAWEILSDSRSRAVYDDELQASRQDAETGEEVSFKEMTIEDIGEVVVRFSYQCRCSDHFSIDSSELEELGCSLQRKGSKISLQRPEDATATSVILPCGSCSLKICLIIDDVVF